MPRNFPGPIRWRNRHLWGPQLRYRTYLNARYPLGEHKYREIIAIGDSLVGTWPNLLDAEGVTQFHQPGTASANWVNGQANHTAVRDYLFTKNYDYTDIWVAIHLGTNDRALGTTEVGYKNNLVSLINGLNTGFLFFPKNQCILFGVYPYTSQGPAILTATGCRYVHQRQLLEVDRDPVEHYDTTNGNPVVGGPVDPPVGIHPNRKGQWVLIEDVLRITEA